MADRAKDQPYWQDRRRCSRRPVLWSGRLRAGTQAHDGVILDLSAYGAILRLTEPAVVPANVTVSAQRLGTLRALSATRRKC